MDTTDVYFDPEIRMSQETAVATQYGEHASRALEIAGGSASHAGSGWNGKVRLVHRWLSMAFTLTVAANFVAMANGTPPMWVTYSPLPPLILLLLSGLHMFAMPYLQKRRGH